MQANESADQIGTLRIRQAVVVCASNTRIAERVEKRVEPWCDANYFEHTDAGIIDASVRAGAARRSNVKGHDAAHEINEMVGQAASHPPVGIGQAAVQP